MGTQNVKTTRKIIRQGNNTLTITLPRSWTNQFDVQHGDEVELEVKGNTLILSTDKLFKLGRKEADVTELTKILPTILLSLFRKGYDEIDLRFSNPHTLIVIQRLLLNTGYTLISHTKKSCLIRATGEQDFKFEEMLRKLFLQSKMKIEHIALALETGNNSELNSMVAMSDHPVSIANYCYRMISKQNVTCLEDLRYLQTIVINLENMDNQLNQVIELVIGGKEENEEILHLVNEFKELFCKIYGCYNKKKPELLLPIIIQKDNLAAKLDLISHDRRNNRFFLNMNNGLLYLGNIVDTTLLMSL